MLERTDIITNEILEPITFVPPYPTVPVPSNEIRIEGIVLLWCYWH